MTMPSSVALSQASLAVAILVSTIGTYIAVSPPNPQAELAPSTNDALHSLKLTNKHIAKFPIVPIGLLALHTSSLAYFYPRIPSFILRHGRQNGLNRDLVTWSPATAIPLALILCAGIPLRLVPYGSLGKNFTFALTKPDHLTTTGIYHYVQHPSYTGLLTIIICNFVLLFRVDGTLSCLIPPHWYQRARTLAFGLAPVILSVLAFGAWTRVRQEERMLRAEFGTEWERWHATTARFLPWLF